MGTPDFAVPTLRLLNASSHLVQAVVTVPDKPQGRGRQLRPSAVKQAALDQGLELLQPADLRDVAFLEKIRAYAPDLIIVVAFQILPEVLYSIPHLGAFNLHASLLPKYRGAAPIHWALLKGDTETGVTTFFLKRKVDTGNIILQHRVAITADDNLHSLYDKLCITGAVAVLETVDQISAGEVNVLEQDPTWATPAPKVTTETQKLNFTESAEQCHNRVRAFAPSPAAFTLRLGKRLKIISSATTNLQGAPGTIIALGSRDFTVACGSGALIVAQVQPEGKKAMEVDAYLRGYPLTLGAQLG